MNIIKGLLLQNIYKKQLLVVNDIKFTPREIDIIACVLHGKNVKSIAQFLSAYEKPIRERAVETHILNIRRKIGVNNRNSVINFIEKSDKYKVISSHYLSLLIQKEFKKSLEEVSTLLKPYDFSFLIVLWQERQDDITLKNFVDQLLYYLKFVRVEGAVELSLQDNFDRFHSIPVPQKNQYIIYLVLLQNPTFLKAIKESAKRSGIFEGNSFNQLFLLLQEENLEEIIDLSDFKHIRIDKKPNFYLLFFAIIKQFFPNLDIETIVTDFTKKYHNILGSSNIPYLEFSKKEEVVPPNNFWTKTKSFFMKFPYISSSLITLVIISGFSVNWYLTEHNQYKKPELVEEEINRFADLVTTDQTSTQRAKDNHMHILAVQQAVDVLYNKHPQKLINPEIQSKFNYLSCVLAGNYRFDNKYEDVVTDNYLKQQYALFYWFNNPSLKEFHDYVAARILERALKHYNTRYGITDNDSVEAIKDKLVRHTYAFEDYILLNYYLSRGYMSTAMNNLSQAEKFKITEKYLSIAILGKEYNMFEACAAEKNKLILERDKAIVLMEELEQGLKQNFPIVQEEKSLISIIKKINSENLYKQKFQEIIDNFLPSNSKQEFKLKQVIDGFVKLENDGHRYINHYRPWKQTKEEFLIPKNVFFNVAVMCKENLRTQAVLMQYYVFVHYDDFQKLQQTQTECLSNSFKKLYQFLEHREAQAKWNDTAIKSQRKMLAKAVKRLGNSYYDEKATEQIKLIAAAIEDDNFNPKLSADISLIIRTYKIVKKSTI